MLSWRHSERVQIMKKVRDNGKHCVGKLNNFDIPENRRKQKKSYMTAWK